MQWISAMLLPHSVTASPPVAPPRFFATRLNTWSRLFHLSCHRRCVCSERSRRRSTLPRCLRVCFDYESIGKVGLSWESGAQCSVMLLLWPSAHQSLKKSLNPPLQASNPPCIYIWLYSIKWSGCMFSNFLKNLFQPPIHKDGVFSLRFVCIPK